MKLCYLSWKCKAYFLVAKVKTFFDFPNQDINLFQSTVQLNNNRTSFPASYSQDTDSQITLSLYLWGIS